VATGILQMQGRNGNNEENTHQRNETSTMGESQMHQLLGYLTKQLQGAALPEQDQQQSLQLMGEILNQQRQQLLQIQPLTTQTLQQQQPTTQTTQPHQQRPTAIGTTQPQPIQPPMTQTLLPQLTTTQTLQAHQPTRSLQPQTPMTQTLQLLQPTMQTTQPRQQRPTAIGMTKPQPTMTTTQPLQQRPIAIGTIQPQPTTQNTQPRPPPRPQEKNQQAQRKKKEEQLEQKITELEESIKEMEQDQLEGVKKIITEKMKPSKTNKKAGEIKASTTASSDESSSEKGKKQKGKKKTEDIIIPDYSDDDTSLNDGIDYTKEENYAVKKFIGYCEVAKKRNGKVIQLITRWKGWRTKDSITLEPLQTMVQDWPKEVKEYCSKEQSFDAICRRDYPHLFN